MFNLPCQLFRKELSSDTKMNQIYRCLQSDSPKKGSITIYTCFFKSEEEKKCWLLLRFEEWRTRERREEEEEENEKRRIDCLSTWKVDLYFRRRRKKREIFLTLFVHSLSTPMYVVCVREDFPSRRYCNICAPFLCPVFCDNLPLPLGMIIRKFKTLSREFSFMNQGITTRCVSACCGYIVFV